LVCEACFQDIVRQRGDETLRRIMVAVADNEQRQQ